MTYPTARLSEVASVRHGGTPSKKEPRFWNGDIPWVSPKDMGAPVLTDTEDHITPQGVAGSATSLMPANCIFVVARSGVLAHSVPVALARRPMAFNQDLKAIIVDPAKLEAEFAFWFLRSQERRILVQGVKRGATVHSLHSGFVEKLSIPLPPLSEQRRIVAILNRANGIRRLRREALDKSSQLIPALFVDMFGDPATNRFSSSVLGDHGEVQGGLQVTSKRAVNPIEVPYLRVANVHRDRLNLSEVKTIRVTTGELARTNLQAGDLLFVEGHGNPDEIGRCAVWNGSIGTCVHQNHLIRVRLHLSTLNPVFASSFFNSSQGVAQLRAAGKTTSGLNTISTSNVKSVRVPVPPIRLQDEFAANVADIEATIAQQERMAEASNRLVASLMAQLFSGVTERPGSMA